MTKLTTLNCAEHTWKDVSSAFRGYKLRICRLCGTLDEQKCTGQEILSRINSPEKIRDKSEVFRDEEEELCSSK